MGQKINPIGFRMGISATWASRWFADPKKYKEYLTQDIKIRETLMKKLRPAGVAKVEIERSSAKVKIIIHVSRPGILIGRGGSGLTDLKKFLLKLLSVEESNLEIVPMDLKAPYLSAYLLGQSVAEQLIRRLPPQRVMNQAVERAMRAGAKGVKIALAGRIGGSEIARRESKSLGALPLHTLRLDIDYAHVPALTKSGYVGIKIWINRGEAVI